MTAKEQYSNNLLAIKELLKAFRSNTEVNKEVLDNFQGYGRLKEVLLNPYEDSEWGKTSSKYRPDVTELYDTIKAFTKGNDANFKKMINSIKSSTLTAYYTPNEIVNPIVNSLLSTIDSDQKVKVLEPACGNGVFFKSLLAEAKAIDQKIELHGVEKDSLSAAITDKLYPSANIHKSALEMTNIANDSFDIVLSNIPFGSIKVYDPYYRKELKGSARKLSEHKIHNYFFAKGMDLVKPGGSLAYFTSTGVADSERNAFIREHLIKEATLTSAVRLPNNTFSDAGTKVNTDVLIFQKRERALTVIDENTNLSELDRAFITTNEYTYENITNSINGVFCNEHGGLSKRVLGTPELGYMHDKQVITFIPREKDLDISVLGQTIQESLDEDFTKDIVFLEDIEKANPKQEISNLLGTYIFKELWKGDLSAEQEHDICFLIDNLEIQDNQIVANTFAVDSIAFDLGINPDVLISGLNGTLNGLTPEQIALEKAEVVKTDQIDLFSTAPSTTPRQKTFVPKTIKEEVKKLEDIKFNEEKWNKVKNFVNEGDIFVLDEVPGVIDFSDEGPILIPFIHKNDKEVMRFKKAALVSIAFKRLVHFETESFTSEIVTEQRETLNTLYDDYVSDFGQFNDKKNRKLLALVPNKSELEGLELLDEETKKYEKADILTSSTFVSELEITLDIEDAITKSLNKYGNIDIDYITQITELNSDEVIKKGLDKNLIFPNPQFKKDTDFTTFKPNNKISYKWESKEEFLSGPVRHKISQLTEFGDTIYNGNKTKQLSDIAILNEVDLPLLSIQDIAPKLGEAWIPVHIMKDFAENVFETEVGLTKKATSHSYNLNIRGYSSIISNEYKVETVGRTSVNGKDLFEYALAGTKPTIKYKVKNADGSSRSYLDKKAMTSAGLKIDKLNQLFTDYINERPEISELLSNKYNNTQNLKVNKSFDGSHLTFPGLVGYTPYQHQKDAIWQNLKNDGGLNDHIVGAGKTLIMIATAMEMKRMGISNKTLITALKANTGEIAKDFKKAYPNAKVLCPKASDFTPAKREAFYQKMANNDWDAVIMTHQQFGMIPQSREIQTKVLESELEALENDLQLITGDQNADKRQLKGLQTRKENSEADIRRLADSIAKDPDMLTFDKFGFGHVIVDESHEFKNLLYTTRFDRVAGLGPSKGSAMALNMLFAVRTMQEQKGGDKGITFCSGTPISNSMVELYSLFKYLAPSELEFRNMTNFDAWARTYANVSTEYELSVTNEVKSKERFREFNKVPELADWYRSITNVANDDNIVLDKPLPNNIMVEVEATPLQQEMSKELIAAIHSEDFSYFGLSYSKEQLNAKMLIATNIASKMSLDVRSLDPTLDVTAGSKLLTLSKNIAENYDNSSEYLGTQLVFCDIETPTSKNAKVWNAYDGLKDLLINKYNIPEEEIAYIHDHDSTINKKNKLFKRVNDGEIRVLLGSSKKMGVGVNVQKRIVAMHHVTIPWTPHWVTQRIGRGSRQGNWAAKNFMGNKVNNYTYATSGTLDAYKYFVVELKQNFINQIKSNTITSRNLDEGDIGTDGSMSPAAFIARLSGKEELLEKNKVDQKISDVRTKISVIEGDQRRAKNNINTNSKTLPKTKAILEVLRQDLKHYNDCFKVVDNKPVFTFKTPEGMELKTTKDIGGYVKTKVNSKTEVNLPGTYKMGTVGDFQLNVVLTERHDLEDDEKYIHKRLETVSMNTDREYTNSSFIPQKEGSIGREIYDSLREIATDINSYERAIEQMDSALISDQAILDSIDVTIYDNELKDLVDRSAELQAIIEQDQDGDNDISVNEQVYHDISSGQWDNAKEKLDTIRSLTKLEECKEFINNHPEFKYDYSAKRECEEIINGKITLRIETGTFESTTKQFIEAVNAENAPVSDRIMDHFEKHNNLHVLRDHIVSLDSSKIKEEVYTLTLKRIDHRLDNGLDNSQAVENQPNGPDVPPKKDGITM